MALLNSYDLPIGWDAPDFKLPNTEGNVISPNNAITHPEDYYEIMKEKKIEWNIPFNYLHDASQEIAKAYKAQCTPELYLLKNTDGAWKLFYHGRINDNWQDPTA